ncbi:MAG: sulfite exporter TauE/SafE family protein [Thermoplasmata archaeon]|nr:sulfite exporter TauE/SafE family protein [Thermoplasmata archaeon]
MLLLGLLLLLALIAVGAGFLGSLAGLGGGVILTPVLVIGFHVPFILAVGASAISVLATSSASGAAYVRDHLTDLRIGTFLQIASVPGAIVGAAAVIFLSQAGLDSALLVGFGVLVLALIPGSLARRNEELPTGVVPDALSRRFRFGGRYHDSRLGTDVRYQAEQTPSALGVMFGAGIISGLFGVGGGVLKVVALEREMHLPMKVSTATSNLMIGVTVAAGASVLLVAGYVSPLLAAPVALGTTIGAYFGSRLLPSLSNTTVRWIFLPVIAAIGIEVILQGLGLP